MAHGTAVTVHGPKPARKHPLPRGQYRDMDTPLMLMSAESRSAGCGRLAGLNHPGGEEGRTSREEQSGGEPARPNAPVATWSAEEGEDPARSRGRGPPRDLGTAGERKGDGGEVPLSPSRVVAAEGWTGGGGRRRSRDGRAAAILSCGGST